MTELTNALWSDWGRPERIADALAEQVRHLDADIGDLLVDHPRVRFINFTGSLATGSITSSAPSTTSAAAATKPGPSATRRVR